MDTGEWKDKNGQRFPPANRPAAADRHGAAASLAAPAGHAHRQRCHVARPEDQRHRPRTKPLLSGGGDNDQRGQPVGRRPGRRSAHASGGPVPVVCGCCSLPGCQSLLPQKWKEVPSLSSVAGVPFSSVLPPSNHSLPAGLMAAPPCHCSEEAQKGSPLAVAGELSRGHGALGVGDAREHLAVEAHIRSTGSAARQECPTVMSGAPTGPALPGHHPAARPPTQGRRGPCGRKTGSPPRRDRWTRCDNRRYDVADPDDHSATFRSTGRGAVSRAGTDLHRTGRPGAARRASHPRWHDEEWAILAQGSRPAC